MAQFKVTSPDGKSYTINAPDDAHPEDVAAYAKEQVPQFEITSSADTANGLRRRVRSPEEVARSKRDFLEAPEQKQRWADINRRVALERATDTGSPIVGTTGRDILRNLSEGTPVGSWLDEANSGLADVANRVTGGRVGEPYQDRMDYHAAYDAQKDADSTVLGSLPVIGDVTAGGLTKIAGGVMSAPFAPMARVFQGATILPQVGNAAATGIGYGAGYGAGQGQGIERGQNALMGGAIGGVAGPIIPLAAGAAGHTYNALMNRFTPMPRELQGIDRGAATRVSEDFVAGGLADPNSPNYYPNQARRLGPEATLMDMSRATENAGMGVAAAGGEGAENIAQTLRFRRENAPARIQREVDAAIGQPENIPEFIENTRRLYGARTAPLYEAFHATPIRVTPELAALLERAQASGAYDAAAQIMRIRGIDPNLPANNGLFIDLIKQGVDAMGERAAAAGNRSLARDYSTLSRAIREETDSILSPSDPANSVWAQGRRVSGEGKGLEDAIDQGRDVFKRGTTPDQLRADMRNNSQLENEGVMVGAREAVRSEMGAAATQFRATPDNASRRLLNSNDAREKLAMVAGPAEARAVGNRIDIENRFAETENRVLGNSVTAERQAARERYAGGSNRDVNMRSMSATGLVAEAVHRMGNALLRGTLDERRLRQLIDSGRLLSADRGARDQFARGLMQFGRQNARNHAQAQMIERAAQAILDSTRTKAIESATE